MAKVRSPALVDGISRSVPLRARVCVSLTFGIMDDTRTPETRCVSGVRLSVPLLFVTKNRHLFLL